MTANDDRAQFGADGATEPGSDALLTALDALLLESHGVAAHQLPDLATRHARAIGALDAVMYLADLQQTVLLPFHSVAGADETGQGEVLLVDSTLAGRTFQYLHMHSQRDEHGRTRVWLPLIDGSERLGVLAVTLDTSTVGEDADVEQSLWAVRLRRFATVLAEFVMTKTLYGDTVVRLRRLADMGIAAEMQWGLLPPLTFACRDVMVTGALEPAYQVAGDSFDYAVDAGIARAAIFDGMGHGLGSAQLSVMATTAYRNARRSGRTLIDTVCFVDNAVAEAFGGGSFSTAVFTELDTVSGVLRWASAGHPTPLLIRDGRLVKQLSVRPALPLGLRAGRHAPVPVTVATEQLQPGDRVVLYTDGVVEARSPDGDFFGERRLVDLLSRNFASGLPAPETLRRVVRALLEHQQGHLDDDATVLLLEWRTEDIKELTDLLTDSTSS